MSADRIDDYIIVGGGSAGSAFLCMLAVKP